MDKHEAAELLDKQAAFLKEKGHFAGLAPGVNGAQIRRAKRILAGEEEENAPPRQHGRIEAGSGSLIGGDLEGPHSGPVIPKGEGLFVPPPPVVEVRVPDGPPAVGEDPEPEGEVDLDGLDDEDLGDDEADETEGPGDEPATEDEPAKPRARKSGAKKTARRRTR